MGVERGARSCYFRAVGVVLYSVNDLAWWDLFPARRYVCGISEK